MEDYVLDRGVLRFPDGQQRRLKSIGKGTFARAYLDEATQLVYLLVRQDFPDYGKEILAHFTAEGIVNPHLPPTEDLGFVLERGREYRLYRMLRYDKLTAKSSVAWQQAKVLQKCRDDAYKAARSLHGYAVLQHYGYEVMDEVVQCVAAATKIPQSLLDAVGILCDAAANYGADYIFEFQRQNLAVDQHGTLILLDTLFGMETLQKLRAQEHSRS